MKQQMGWDAQGSICTRVEESLIMRGAVGARSWGGSQGPGPPSEASGVFSRSAYRDTFSRS